MDKEKDDKLILLIIDFFREMFETKKDLNRLYINKPSMAHILKKYEYESVYNELLIAVNGFNINMKESKIEKERDELFKKFLDDYPEFNTGKDRVSLLRDTRELVECIHREYRELKMYMVYIYTLLDGILSNIIEIAEKPEVSKGIKVKIKELGLDDFKKFQELKVFNAERNAIVHSKGVFNERSIKLIGGEIKAKKLGICEGEEVELSKEKIIKYIDLSLDFLRFVENNRERII